MPTQVWAVLFVLTMVALVLFASILMEEPRPLPPCSQICVEHVHGG